jgi:hypothetical protein
VSLREQVSSHQRSQLSLHFDLKPLPRPLRVNCYAVHERPEIIDQRTPVVLCASVAGHRLGKGVNSLDVAVQEAGAGSSMKWMLSGDDKLTNGLRAPNFPIRKLFINADRPLALP